MFSMLTLIHGNGIAYLEDNPGFVVTDCPKNWLVTLTCLAERKNVTFINAYAREWLQNGKFPGEKAIDPYRAIIRAFPDEKVIVDPFMGSGTTGMAAILEDREFIGIEIDAERFKYAESRLQNTAAGANPYHF